MLVRLLALGTLAIALPACGRADDREQVTRLTRTFLQAVAHHDGTRACALLSHDAAMEVADQAQGSCRAGVLDLRLAPHDVTRVQVYIVNAKVDLAGGESAFAELTTNGWRLSAVGCTVEGGKPADRPYQCEAQA